MGAVLTGIGSVVGAIGGLTQKAPKAAGPNAFPPFRGPVNTPSFTLAGGTLTRTPAGQGILDQERRLQGLLGDSRSRIQALTGAGSALGGTLGQIEQAEARIPGLFGQTAALQGTIGELLNQVQPGFGRVG